MESYIQEQARQERISEVRADDRIMESHLFDKDQAIEKMNLLVEDGNFMLQQSDWFGRMARREYAVFVRFTVSDDRQCLVGCGKSWCEAISDLTIKIAKEKKRKRTMMKSAEMTE